MSTKFLSPSWRMPRNANQSKQSNYSMDFDGGSSWITVPTNDSFAFGTGGFTISSWVNFPTDSGQEMILEFRSGGYKLWKQADETILWNKGSLFVQTTTSLSLNTWYLVTVLNTGSSTSIYIDGNLDSSVVSDTASYSASNLYIGKFEYGGYAYRGKMGAVSIFNYPLSSSQITTLYGDSTNGPGNPMALPSPPVAYYPLGTSAWNGQYLAENNAIGDYVFKIQSGDKIDTGIINLGYQFTVSFWFQRTVTGEYRLLNVTDSAGAANTRYLVDIVYPGSNQVFSHITDTSGFQSIVDSNIPLNSWIHCAYTRNGRDSNIYLSYDNGFNQNSGANSMQFPASEATTNTYIANLIQSIPGDGFLSNVNYFTSILTLSEIETLYNNGSPIQTLANIPQSSNLKAWYKLDASEIYDSSTTEWKVNNATAEYKSSTFVDGLVGQATGYVQVGNYDALAGAQAGSWSFWYNTKSTAGRTKNCSWLVGPTSWIQPSGTVMSGNAEFTLNTSNGLQRTSVSASYSRRIFLDASDASSLNEWVHVVGTYDGSNLRVYVDGEQKGLVNEAGTNIVDFPATGTITTGNIQIGSGNNLVYFLSAMYSNLSIWDKALTLSEINEIYNSGQPKSLSSHTAASNLISWWTLDNFTTGLVDSIGGYNASLVGSDSHVSPGTVSVLNGESSGMSQSNLVQSDLQTVAPYSKYALSFDGILDTVLLGNAPIVTGVFTISIWIKRTSTSSPESAVTQSLISKDDIGSNRVYSMFLSTSTGFLSFWVSSTGSYDSTHRINTSTAINDTEWHNIVFINNGNNINNQVYVDGAEASYTDQGTGVSSLHYSTINSTACGNDYYAPVNAYCSMSNISMWTSAFSPSQVIEIYNEGLPSNLNSHSAVSSLASWWQLGENSSFDGSNWTCINEVASNNGQTRSVPVSALTNGVGTTANGVSTGMSEGSLIGEAPYSTGNAISSGMPVTARGTDVP